MDNPVFASEGKLLKTTENNILKDVDQLIDRAGDWCSQTELSFLNSIREQVVTKGKLSDKQNNWFKSLADKYSQDSIARSEHWMSLWDDKKRLEAIRVAHYYSANPPYYSSYVERILTDQQGFVLSEAEWKKFCENKYAKRIRQAYNADPLFAKGGMVQVRKANRLDIANQERNESGPGRYIPRGYAPNELAIVLQVDARPVTRAAKGSRIYEVLLVGSTSPIWAHEADLKSLRGVKNVKKN